MFIRFVFKRLVILSETFSPKGVQLASLFWEKKKKLCQIPFCIHSMLELTQFSPLFTYLPSTTLSQIR